MSFILRMAWRDSRASRRRLLAYSLSIVLGVAALVAIGSLGANLKQAIEDQARGLLGADLAITSRVAFTPEVRAHLETLGGERSEEVSFASMAIFPGSAGAARLVSVRALEGGFPFYGEFLSDPVDARSQLGPGTAIVEETLLAQFDVKVGDAVQLGRSTFRIVGALRNIPGESAAVAMLSPRVYLPLGDLSATGLLERGSIVRYKAYLRLPETVDARAVERDMRERFRETRMGYDTVEERKRDLGRALENVNAFLGLVGFVALFLGAIGVASAVHVHVRQRIPTVAMLRCLGATARQAFGVYLVQGLALGVCGAGLGALIGIVVQLFLPRAFAGLLPVDVRFFIAWGEVARGVGAGLVICVLFTLLPLLAVRRVSPLVALRAAFADTGARDPLRWLVLGLIAAAVAAFAYTQAPKPEIGAGFAGMIFGAVGLLALLAKLLAWAVRRWTPKTLPYVWRQGLANLHRPQNRTVLLLLALGLGTFLMVTLYLTRATLLAQIQDSGSGERPNLIFFDIQDDQLAGVREELVRTGAQPPITAPIVTMRLSHWKGRPVEEVSRDRALRVEGWTLRREYRSTFREQLEDTEKLLRGEFVPRVAEGTEPIPISVEEGLLRDLQLDLGDELTFDVQGVPMRTRVASVRQVEWRRMSPNFFVVFPAGVLEAAPKFHIVATRVAGTSESAAVQRAVVGRFPNISAIDLALVLQTLDGIFSKVAFIVQFLAAFTVGTGVIVLAGALLTGRFQRVRETVLLRTLGATEKQVRQIMLVEYAVLGVLAALTGVLLAGIGNELLAHFVFQSPAARPVAVWGGAVVLVSALTVVTGLLANRGVARHPPLEVLRAEV